MNSLLIDINIFYVLPCIDGSRFYLPPPLFKRNFLFKYLHKSTMFKIFIMLITLQLFLLWIFWQTNDLIKFLPGCWCLLLTQLTQLFLLFQLYQHRNCNNKNLLNIHWPPIECFAIEHSDIIFQLITHFIDIFGFCSQRTTFTAIKIEIVKICCECNCGRIIYSANVCAACYRLEFLLQWKLKIALNKLIKKG